MTATPNGPACFPALQTNRLVLRSLTMEDADFVFRHFRDPGMTQYLLDEPPLADYAQAQAMIHFCLEPEGKTYNRWELSVNPTTG